MSNIQIKDNSGNKMYPISSFSNRNLLDNPWFTVNQRNVSSGNNYGYMLDRWIFDFGTASSYNYNNTTYELTLNPDGRIIQYLEPDMFDSLNGKKITASVLLSNGTIYKGTITNNKTQQDFIINSEVRILITNSGRLYFYNTKSTSSITIKAIKLELGEISTLVNDIAPDYSEELRKCQRYYFSLSNIMVAGAITNTAGLHFDIDVPSPMRTLPIVSFSSSNPFETIRTIKGIIYISTYNLNSAVAALTSQNHIGVDCQLDNIITSDFTGTPCEIRMNVTMIFSADL